MYYFLAICLVNSSDATTGVLEFYNIICAVLGIQINFSGRTVKYKVGFHYKFIGYDFTILFITHLQGLDESTVLNLRCKINHHSSSIKQITKIAGKQHFCTKK